MIHILFHYINCISLGKWGCSSDFRVAEDSFGSIPQHLICCFCKQWALSYYLMRCSCWIIILLLLITVETAVLRPALEPFSDYPLCPYRSARTFSSGAQSCFTCCSYHLISPFKELLSTLTYTLWYTAKPCSVLCNLSGKVLPERDKKQARRDFFQLSHLCFFSLVTKTCIRVVCFLLRLRDSCLSPSKAYSIIIGSVPPFLREIRLSSEMCLSSSLMMSCFFP